MPPEPIQPIVLVGGASRRFGRDKLREPMGDGWLIDAPIRALRSVFGPIVAAVGECDPAVATRFSRIIPDNHPGRGPIGGIISALTYTQSSVFVLAGDLPHIDADTVRAVLAAAESYPSALAVFARSGRIEPCIALYRPASLPILQDRLLHGRLSLHDAIPAQHAAFADVSSAAIRNANTPSDLPSNPHPSA